MPTILRSNPIKMKQTALVAAGFLSGCILAMSTMPRYMAWSHRRTVAQYARSLHRVIEGTGSASEMPPDPIVSLAFLEQAGELHHLARIFHERRVRAVGGSCLT